MVKMFLSSIIVLLLNIFSYSFELLFVLFAKKNHFLVKKSQNY